MDVLSFNLHRIPWGKFAIIEGGKPWDGEFICHTNKDSNKQSQIFEPVLESILVFHILTSQ